jgi:HEAT repeat protein
MTKGWRWVMAALLAAGWGHVAPVQAAQARWLDAVEADDPDDEADDPDDDDDDEKPADRAEELYEEATDALDEEQWDQAIARIDELLRIGGPRTEGALYWKAYALGKSGRKPEALAVIAQLRRQAPQSRWARESQALEMEIRQSTGERPRPEAAADEDVKLMALNALLAADSARAIPMLERFLSSSGSRKLRDRALFVLTQSGAPEARAIVVDIAKGRRQPELQRSAIRYLGVFGSAQSRQALSEIYAGAADASVKKSVLQAYMVAGDKQSLLAAARGETSADLRQSAIRQLGAMGAQAELWEMYRAESDVATKKSILHGMFIGGGDQRLIDLSRTEQNPELRRSIVRNLGLLGTPRTGETLVALYRSDPDPGIRREAIQGLFLQGNATALVQLARAEKDPALRKELVSKLSLMNTKEAVDYMMELLK